MPVDRDKVSNQRIVVGRVDDAPTMCGVRVAALDHVVLTVADVERSLAWYSNELGLAPVRLEEWRNGEVPFPSLRIDATTIIDLLPGIPAGRNMDHLCLVVGPGDLDHVVTCGHFHILDGPAPRFGARGEGISVYVQDPDGNVVELRQYT